ncbi:hypothetical protein EBZ38_00025 [bacterium]|nr:hypothetical protein [bacterium]NDD82656.1 hypothetical protein [bacterium]
MYYQLPNGKTIWIDPSDAIDMTAEDIQILLSMNIGEYVHNPFRRGVLDQASKREPEEEEETETEETEQLSDYYREFYPDEFPDVPDEDIDLDSFEE